jgi:xylan 1,4-beta-xylosidase
MSYWTFTDIFEEAGPRTTPFHGGFGLLNYQDLKKPSYFAYRFLNRLGPTELACPDPAAFVCRDEAGGVQALFWDFTIPHPVPAMIDQEYYRADHPAAALGGAELRLAHLRPGPYQLRATRVGYRSNDVQAAWRDLGSPAQLTRGQVAVLRAASAGDPLLRETVTVGPDGTFARRFELRQNDVWLAELTPAGGP